MKNAPSIVLQPQIWLVTGHVASRHRDYDGRDYTSGDYTVPIARIDAQQIQAFLNAHPHWREVGGKLHCEFRFSSFVQAFGFMTQSALIAERADHHPEWFNVYNLVVVDLVTHDASGISQRDIDMACAMETIAASMVQSATP